MNINSISRVMDGVNLSHQPPNIQTLTHKSQIKLVLTLSLALMLRKI